jgi:hypothetical protein
MDGIELELTVTKVERGDKTDKVTVINVLSEGACSCGHSSAETSFFTFTAPAGMFAVSGGLAKVSVEAA